MFLLNADIFLWDLLILMLMGICLALSIGCFVLRHRIFALIAFFAFVTVIYASFIEPQIIVVTREELADPLGSDLRIAIVSDYHVGPYKDKRFVQKSVKKINALLPDIVLLPGDFVFTRSADVNDLNPLKDLHPSIGAYAVLGNHDVGQYQSMTGVRYSGESRGEAIADKLKSLGITVLRNEHVLLSTTHGQVAIAGVDDIWTGHDDLPAALRDIPKAAYTILLSHNPSIIKDPQSLSANLIVSGHTHGGQMRLPGVGSLAHLPTSIDQAFDQGLFTIQDSTKLAITRGIGESSARTRLFAWPEILLIDLISSR